ncbi:hypothetical protein ACFYXS_37525 [Streptomyces sp. NPDC002574]|uniref:hypothetical protein n=1 Tax=Streptomyces sp. NPDC002574 TaxID=3364652 RepID=UPI00369D0B0B
MSSEVRRVLGSEGMSQARQEAQRAECASCTGKITDRANVVVTGAAGLRVQVWFAHPGCMPSAVTELLRETLREPGEDMRMTSLPPLPGGHGRAVLVAELQAPQFFADTPQTELTDVLAPYLLRHGFEPVSDTATAPPLLERWLAVLTKVAGIETGGSLLTIVDDHAEVFFTGPVFTPTRWRQAGLVWIKGVVVGVVGRV